MAAATDRDYARSIALLMLSSATRIAPSPVVPRVLSSRRPPARVWLWLAAEYQPGLTDARNETGAKLALAAGVAEMGFHASSFGPDWGNMEKPLASWDSRNRLTTNDAGMPKHLFLSHILFRRSLSPHLWRLKSLSILNLSGNQLAALPDAIGHLTNLTILHIVNNQLTALPDTIGRLTRLARLSVDENQLIALPDTIGHLTHLSTLHLSQNQLAAVPDAIGRLTNLTILDLQWNKLTSLPDTLVHLTRLTQLRLYGNLFRYIPFPLAHMKSLSYLDLSQNPLRCHVLDLQRVKRKVGVFLYDKGDTR